MTKNALVIHPRMSYYAGGELLCLYVCMALQEVGYKVTLASDVFSPADAERFFGLGNVVQQCDHRKVAVFSPILPYFVSLQRIPYAMRMRTMFSKTNADVVFSTQSTSFYVPKRKLFHFVYNILDLFNHPQGSSLSGPESSKEPIKKPYYFLLRQVRRFFWDKYSPTPAIFFAVGSLVLQDLKERGYENSRLIFPPCRTSFKPRFPKKKQVVQYTRILPNKRIELFSEIARLLPQYPFYLVGRTPSERSGTNHEYSQRILRELPRNVTYVDALTRERPDLLEDSKVYLYTGTEAGIGVALVEAIAAGCVPFSPYGVGAVDIIEAAGVGHLFSSAQQGAERIETTLEDKQTAQEVHDISDKASMFSPESFEEQIKKLVS